MKQDEIEAETVAEVVVPTAAEVNTAEHWATRAGYLPAVSPAGARNPRSWMFASAKQLRAWPEGAEMTEVEFVAAIVEATVGTSHG